MKKNIIVCMVLASFFVSPVMARSGGKNGKSKEERQEIMKSLNEDQQAALKKFRMSMKELRKSDEGEKEARKAVHMAHKEEAKAAFVKGDFAKLAELKKQNKLAREKQMEARQVAKTQAMQDAFGKLSDKDREGLVDVVLKKKPRKGRFEKRDSRDSKER